MSNAKKKPEYIKLTAKQKAEVAIAAAFIVQALGSATLKDIHQELRNKLYIKVHQGTLKHALKALQKKGIVSFESHWEEEKDRRLEFYAMKKLKFMELEAAHWKELLPKLIEDDLTTEIFSIFNENEGGTGDGDRTKGKKHPKGQTTITAKFRLQESIYGGALLSQTLKRDIEEANVFVPDSEFERKAKEVAMAKSGGKRKTPKKEEVESIHEDMLYFRRDVFRRCLIISSAACSGFMSSVFVLGKKPISWCKKMGFSGALVRPQQGLFLDDLPIQRDGKGAGIKVHETVRAGEIIEMTFTMPSENFVDPDWLRVYVADYAKRPRRSLSPARNAQYGKMYLIGWKVHGERMSMDDSLADVPDYIMEEHGDFLRETEELAQQLSGDAERPKPSAREETARKVREAVNNDNGAGDPIVEDQPSA